MCSTNEDLTQVWAEFDLISSKGFACLPKPGKDAWQAFHQAGFQRYASAILTGLLEKVVNILVQCTTHPCNFFDYAWSPQTTMRLCFLWEL